MQLSPIQLISSSFERLTFEVDMAAYDAQQKARAAGAARDLPSVLPFECDVSYSNLEEQDEVYLGMLRLKLSTKPEHTYQHYRFEMVISGAFMLKGTVPEARRQYLLVVNGAAVLFGICREWLRATTARCRPGIAVLPTVTFQDFLDEKELKQAVEGETKPTVGAKGRRRKDSK
jgi:preprotein translocase subunit SecB